MSETNIIYLDHQSSTPIKESVLQAMLPFWREQHGNPHSLEHSVGWAANQSVERARKQVAAFIGCDEDEILFTSGATEANNIVIKGLCKQTSQTQERQRILVSSIEHKSILETAHYSANRNGYEISEVPVDSIGKIDIPVLTEMLKDNVLLVSIGLVNNEIGTIQDMAHISKLCRNSGAILHSDCAQAACFMQLPNIVEQTDSISISAHKFGGPMGIGALYLRRDLLRNLKPLFHGGGQENGKRAGTLSLPLCVGLGHACENSMTSGHIEKISKLEERRNRFVNILVNSKYEVVLNGDALKNRHPGNAHLNFVGFDAQDILMRLQPKIAASTGSACNSGANETSHVLNALGLSEELASGSIRFSFGETNTDQDVEVAAKSILETLEILTNEYV